jgi:hypothetical protein
MSDMTMNAAIEIVLACAAGRLNWDDFVAQVLALWPSRAKNPAASIRNGLRYDLGRRVVLLDKDTLLPVHVVMAGLRFRITLSAAEAEKGAVRLVPWFAPFPLGLDHLYNVEAPIPRLLDEEERTIETRRTSLTIQVENWRGELEDVPTPALDLASWLAACHPRPGDSLLVTVRDWKEQAYRLDFEPAREKKQAEVEQQNEVLTRALYEQISHHRQERPFAREILVYAYAQLGEAARAYPGDHWSVLVEADPRLGHLGYQELGLARYVSFEEELVLRPDPSPADLDRVYRFKASLKHYKRIWRRIEIQGRNTLGEFDQLMRQAFNHDWDHLSEFFARPKDRGPQARWEGYGSHPSFDESRADELLVAELPLQVGDQLKYVYDFGDWIEHLLTLEETGAAVPGTRYPQLTEQNKPRFRYCVSCKEQGRKTKAVWVCIACSNELQRDIWLCDACADRAHEEHYVDEIIY